MPSFGSLHSTGGLGPVCCLVPSLLLSPCGVPAAGPLPALLLLLQAPLPHWPLPAPLEAQTAPPWLPQPSAYSLPAPSLSTGARVSPWRIRPEWGKCLRVYQSSSDCLTAGAGLPASGRLEFQPFSLLNTSLALPPRPHT